MSNVWVIISDFGIAEGLAFSTKTKAEKFAWWEFEHWVADECCCTYQQAISNGLLQFKCLTLDVDNSEEDE